MPAAAKRRGDPVSDLAVGALHDRDDVRRYGTPGSCLPDISLARKGEHAPQPWFPPCSFRRRTLSYPTLARACCVAWFAIAANGCQKEPATPQAAASPSAPSAAASVPAVELKDVFETEGGAVIGISYPAGLQHDPGLARMLRDYAERARANVRAAAGHMPAPDTTCDLSLAFTVVAQNRELIAVALDGSQYTGGPGSEPHLARFVWLRRAARLLPAPELIPSPAGWRAIAAYVRNEQNEALQDEGAEGPADEQRERLDSALHRMKLDPKYMPRLDPQGRIAALRFVLPLEHPDLEVLTTVEVPATVLKPFVAPAYAAWFASPPMAQAGQGAATRDLRTEWANEDRRGTTAMR